MKKPKSLIKVVMINVLVFFMIALFVNLLVSLYLDGKYLWKRTFVPIDKKAYTKSLPAEEQTFRIFREKKLLETRYEPYIAWSRKPFIGETTTVNEEGDRIHPTTTDRPTKHVRFFGGSTIWGTGVDDLHTIPAQFNALHPEYRVYNHGESGFVSRQELARLINLANQHAPMDLVIFYDGCNDCRTLCRADVSINGNREQAKMAQRLEHRWWTVDALFGSVKRFITKFIKKGKRPPSLCKSNPNYAKQVASTTVNNWKIAKSIAESHGAEFHAIIQPVAPLGNPNVEYMDPREKETDWHLVYPIIREIKTKENLRWIHDFTDAFDVKEYIYFDSCHVNNRGNQIIAHKINEVLDNSERTKIQTFKTPS